MPTYIGFNTQNICQPRTLVRSGVDGGIGTINNKPRLGKKYRLVDTQLVLQDLLNAFSIKQGDKVGQPDYGTNLWSYVFEPNTPELRSAIQDEVSRIIATDPRLTLNTVAVYEQENGVLLELEIAVVPFNSATQVGFFLNRYDGSIQQLSQ